MKFDVPSYSLEVEGPFDNKVAKLKTSYSFNEIADSKLFEDKEVAQIKLLRVCETVRFERLKIRVYREL